MSKLIFPSGFTWGSATASYQIEGNWDADGKGESIWDRYTLNPNNTSDHTDGKIACDSYRLYKEDVAFMKEIGIHNYRFSISWPRIFPEGRGKVNRAGVDYYKSLIQCLRENGIKATVTLYHWDLPQKLQDIGGWTNPDIVEYFAEYAALMFRELGDSVDVWVTHNEPNVSAFLGYWLGIHAPGIRDFTSALQAAHHMLLSHGRAVEEYRKTDLPAKIGLVLAMSAIRPETDSTPDKAAALRCDGYWNRWFLDPVLTGCYPEDILDWYKHKKIMPVIQMEQLKTICQPIDFLGINNYYTTFASHDLSQFPLELHEAYGGPQKNKIGWNVNPDGFYDLIMRVHKDYGIPIIITENGAACQDVVNREGKIRDDCRVDYYYHYLIALHRAIQHGADVSGYYIWSLLDDFEWAEGYSRAFGLVHVNYETQKRTIKESGVWYKDTIRNNGFELVGGTDIT